MSTKFIYDTKSIMKKACDMARSRYYHLENVKIRGTRQKTRSFSSFVGEALIVVWAEARSDLIKAQAAENAAAERKMIFSARSGGQGRYVELLAIAERNGLNHGQSWYCGERDIALGMHPMHEGELVCYVYAN